MGNVHNHYNGGDLKDGGLGRKGEKVLILTCLDAGMHAGAGYVWNITEDPSLGHVQQIFLDPSGSQFRHALHGRSRVNA